MIFSISKSKKQKISAKDAHQKNIPCVCPECYDDLIPVLNKSIYHFEHVNNISCPKYYKNNKYENMKMELFKSLTRSTLCSDIEMDKFIVNTVFDLSFYKKGKMILINLVKPTTVKIDMIKCISGCYGFDIPIIWLNHYKESIDKETYNPTEIEKWLQTSCYGRVYYWKSGIKVTPVHFEYNGLSVKPIKNKDISLTTGFGTQSIKFYKFNPEEFPNRIVYIDIRKYWWPYIKRYKNPGDMDNYSNNFNIISEGYSFEELKCIKCGNFFITHPRSRESNLCEDCYVSKYDLDPLEYYDL